MDKLGRALIRISAFLRKEVFEVLRQPRLVLTLVLGPFLILLIFGIGYRNQARALRTLFVAQPGSPIAKDIQQYATNLGPQLIYEGVTNNQNEALNRLRNQQVDLVVVAPDNAYETIRNNQQAVFTLYHREIDPTQVDYVAYFGQFYVDVVNRRVLEAITSQGQADSATLHKDLQAAKDSAAAARTALQNNDTAAANQHEQQLNTNVDSVSLAVGASLGLLSSVQQNLGQGGNNDANDVLNSLSDVRKNTNQLNQDNSGDNNAKIQRLNSIENDLNTMDTKLAEFRSIEPSVIVSPFRSETKSVTPIQPSAPDFFAPAVLALLLQHLALTFAALSIVGERTLGTTELFRVSPLSAAETLIGKYISYMIFGGMIAAILTLLLVFGLHVPMLGSWINYSIVIAAVLFASLSIGFVISIISQNDSQAVQFSMIVLLATIFFSGFIMSLDMLWDPVRVVSWLLPGTYGNSLLRDIMLRGAQPSWVLIGGLLAIGLVLCLIAWLLLRRLISTGQK